MRGVIPLLMMTSAACLYSGTGLADTCHGPSAPDAFPDPATATEQQILAAQQTVKQYLTDMESTLKCMDTAHNDSGHNAAVDEMQRTAAKFNGVLRAYRSRQKV